jgi:cytochrome P450
MDAAGIPDPETIDFFTDSALMADAYGYYEGLRTEGPVWQEPFHGTFMVTGYEEICAVYRDPETFSSCNSFAGPFFELPEEPADPDDFTALIERFRQSFPFSENFITFDGETHSAHRGLMMRMLTPGRLRENEEFMVRAAGHLIDTFAARGEVEYAREYAQPYSLMVIADLLGVPEEDHQRLRQRVLEAGPAGKLGTVPKGNLLWYLEEFFEPYIEERRREPRQDVLTVMAHARFPDGSVPSVTDVVRVATILFSGGQGTSARYQIALMKLLAENADLQRRVREDRALLPNLIEEGLRFKSPTKINQRLALRSTEVGGVRIPAGSTLVLLLGAADRDPDRFECPAEFEVARPNAREHVAFGRGPHSCPGAPLVRAEARITLEHLLDRFEDLSISEKHHGPPENRRFVYTPSYIMQGVEELHVEFKLS